jgi:hypothetical protein
MYVIYKEIKLPTVGGVHPQNIEVGLAYYKGWNLAKCPDERAHYYKEFDFVAVPNNIAQGLQVLDRLLVEDAELVNPAGGVASGYLGAPALSQLNSVLTETDEANRAAAEKFINNLELK